MTPPDEGVHGALLVAVSVNGAVAGSIANFVHPYVMRQMGWTGPERRGRYGKEYRNNLFENIALAFATGLALWVAFQLGVDLFT